MTEVKFQGNRSTCAAFATIGLLEFELQKKLGRQVNLSEEFMLYQTNEHFLIKDETSDIRDYLDQAYDIGVLTEEQWPYQPYYFDKGYPCYQHAASGIQEDSAVCSRLYKPAESVLKNATRVKLVPTYAENIKLDRLLRLIYARPQMFCFPTEAFGYTDGNGVIAISKKLQQKLNSLR